MSAQYSYDDESNLSEVARYSNGALVSTTNYGYDGNGNVLTELDKDGSGNILESYTNAYDNQNRITSQNLNGTVTNYTYDANSQVTSAGGSSYSFDANGNQNSSGFVIGPANEITSDGTWNYTYDAVGDTVQMTNIASGIYWTYGYNLNNQVTSAAEVWASF